MSGVFQNIDPSPPNECVPPCLWCGGEDTLAGWRGGGGANILEDARHCSVLNIRKYFVPVRYGEKPLPAQQVLAFRDVSSAGHNYMHCKKS
jgi:hypothetical protein